MNQLEITRFPELDYSCKEAMNTLCTNLSYSGDGIKTILITSRYDLEGKSFVAMNLMRSLAELEKKVVVLDADLRRSGANSWVQLKRDTKQTYGLAQYLAGTCTIDDIVYSTNISNAYMVPAGRKAANPVQLLNTVKMPELMEFLKSSFDIVLVDTSPAGMVVDALDIAKYCDGSIIVVSYKRGKCKDIADIRDMIRKTGCQVLGTVMNNVEFNSLSSRHYYYRSERYASYYRSQYAPKFSQKRKKKVNKE